MAVLHSDPTAAFAVAAGRPAPAVERGGLRGEAISEGFSSWAAGVVTAAVDGPVRDEAPGRCAGDLTQHRNTGVSLVSYPAMLDVPHEVVEYVSWLIYARRRELNSRWCRLGCFRQALLTLVHLRKNETHAQVGAGFGASTVTVGWYVAEAVEVRPAGA